MCIYATIRRCGTRLSTLEGFLTQRYDGWSVCEQYLHSVLLLSVNIRTSNLPNLLIIGIRGAQFVSCIYRVPVSIEKNCIVTVFDPDTKHILLTRGIEIRNRYIKFVDVEKQVTNLTVTPETCPCFCHRRFSHATV
jgi:hypothetical protein